MAQRGTISQRISLDSDVVAKLSELARAGQEAFGKISQAAEASAPRLKRLEDGLAALDAKFKQLGTGGGKLNLTTQLNEASDALAKTRGEIDSAGKSIKDAGNNASSGVSSLVGGTTKLVGVLTAVGVAAVGAVAGLVAIAKNSADSVEAIDKAAEKLGTSPRSFQQLQFALRLAGLSAKETEAAITKFGEATKAASEVGAEALDKLGFRFAKTDEGAANAADLMSRLGNVMHDTKRRVDETTDALLKGNRAFKTLVDNPRAAVEAFGAFADALSKIRDPAKQAEAATQVLGKELGEKLLESMRTGGDGVRAFVEDFNALRLELGPGGKAALETFSVSLRSLNSEFARFQLARQAGQREFGALIAPTVTPIIDAAAVALHNFTTAMRAGGGIAAGLQEAIKGIAESFRDFAIPAIKGFFSLLQGQEAGVPPWMISLRDGIFSLGKSFKFVFNDLILPAIESLGAIATQVAKQVNEVFQTKLTPTDVGLLGIITLLVGGFNALAVAVLASLPLIVANFDKFSGMLKANGIDIAGWAQTIKTSVASAFDDLKNVLTGNDAAVKNTWLLGVREFIIDIATSLPGAILIGIAAFKGLNVVLGGVAKVVSKIFGKEITGGQFGLLLVAGQATGALQLLNTVLLTVALSLGALVSVAKLAGLALGGIAAVVGWPVVLIGLLIALVAAFVFFKDDVEKIWKTLWPKLQSIAAAGLEAIKKDLGIQAGDGMFSWIVRAFETDWAKFKSSWDQNWEIIKADAVKQNNETLTLLQQNQANQGSFNETFTRVKEAITKFFADLKQLFIDGGTAVAAAFKDAVTGGMSSAFDGLVTLAQSAWDKIKGIFSSKVDLPPIDMKSVQDRLLGTGGQGGFIDNLKKEWQKFLDFISITSPAHAADVPFPGGPAAGEAFPGAPSPLNDLQASAGPAFDAIKTAAQTAWNEILAGATEMAAQIISVLQGVSSAASFEGISSLAASAAQQVQDAFRQAADGVGSAFDDINSVIQDLISRVEQLIQGLQEAASQAASISIPSGGGDGGGEFATGGHVRGPGSARSDSIIARLSNGEFVVQADAVAALMRRYGAGVMSWINHGKLPGFNMGGLVSGLTHAMSLPRFAAGGMADLSPSSARTPITLVVNGQRISGLSGSDDAVSTIKRAAVSGQLASAGSSPSWVR